MGGKEDAGWTRKDRSGDGSDLQGDVTGIGPLWAGKAPYPSRFGISS